MSARLVVGMAALLASAGAGACGTSAPASDSGGETFVAFAADFKGFHDWPNQAEATPAPQLGPVDAGSVDSDAGVHPLPQRAYWNVNPPSGSTTFPIKFMVVKETEEADPTARHVFAMVKRGGGFNGSGARDWEFYELTNKPDGSVSVQWQGYGPTGGSSDVYGGDPNVCNGCHARAASNDFVWSAALQLSNF